MKQQNMLSVLAASVALALAVPAAQAAVPAGVKLAANQELVRGNGSEVESLDISQVESQPAINVADDLYEGLTTRDAHSKILPGVAESWKQTSPTTWVFHLRKNAKWSNGDPVTAEDFVYSWQRTVDPKTATQYGIFFEFIKNGKDIMSGKQPVSNLGIKATDAHTIEITTETPTAFLPDMLANPQMAPLHKASFVKFGKEFTKPGNLVSNGAYRLKEWVVNSRLVLEKNPNYWDAKNVHITKVTYNPTDSEDATLKMFQAGQLDTVLRAPTGMYQKLLSTMPKEVKTNKLLALYYYSFNNADPVLKDKRVRQALSMVVDRDILTKKVLGEGQVPAYGLTVAGTNGANVTAYDWSKWPMAKRVDEAKKLLTAAGYGPNHPLNLKLSYNTSEAHKKVALFLSSEWKTKLGVTTSMENQEFKVFLKTRHDGAYQVARNGWTVDYNDATSFLDLIRCGSDQNDLKYCSKKVDALITQGKETIDAAKRTALLTQAAKTAMDDYPMMPLYQYTNPYLVKTKVGGWNIPNPTDHYKTQFLYIQQ
ncbi:MULTISPECIES: peptide ABC transporter substrate-binding protein [unclassified Paludibacterium]|uniref:peptide ABC transporter substrate-binding protein n=1 Tax=unclassified Paludibacterium TaxID=2618429 RepID=UPI001C04C796|nr:peptide ABC transporter substrate-binding protein [Paludibacterium sp. B53371]BEV72484.1 peptide ABC transporter substrate-binding protein [Paludibacterium sp. THUN1379]